MATFQSYSSGAGTSLAKPSGLAEGDLLTAIITTADFGTGGAVSAPSGFIELTSLTDTGVNDYIETYVFVKKATSTDVAASTFNFGGGKGILYRFTNAVTSVGNFQSVIAATTGDLADRTPPITGCVILFFQANSNNAGGSDTLTSVTFTGGTAPTWNYDYNGSEAGHSLGVARGVYNSTTTITNIDGDLSLTDDNVKGYVIIRSPASVSGNASLGTTEPYVPTTAGSAGASGNASLGTTEPYVPTTSGEAFSPTVWTTTIKS